MDIFVLISVFKLLIRYPDLGKHFYGLFVEVIMKELVMTKHLEGLKKYTVTKST